MATRIMVIDDEPLICRLLEYQLGGAGYEVTTYQQVHSAMRELACAPPDLLLLDVMMPEISGWDLCVQIRSNSQIPIIMLTAKDGDDDVVRGLTGGADDYVGKPFTQAHLVARIETVLRRAHTPRSRSATHTPAHGTNALALAPTTPALPTASAAPDPNATPLPSDTTNAAPLPRLGTRFAAARQQRGLSLHEAGRASGVRWEFLQAIEHEEFNFVPRHDLRLALQAYGALLNIDLKPYTRRAARTLKPQPLPLTIGMVAVIAIALVLVALVM